MNSVVTLQAEDIFTNLIEKRCNHGSFGRDGARKLLEIRPAPSINAAEIVRRIGFLLKGIEERVHYNLRKHADAYNIKDFSMHIGSYDVSAGGIGGHFHMGIEKADSSIIYSPNHPTYTIDNTVRTSRRDNVRRINSNAGLETSYDTLKICLGLSLLWGLEDYNSGSERRNSGYGFINDIRSGTDNRTIEFRSPSSIWLARPALSKAALKYFQALVENSDKLFRDNSEVLFLTSLAERYWRCNRSGAQGVLNPSERNNYLNHIMKGVKPIVNKKTLSTLTFFMDKIEGLMDSRTKLIRLDTKKWEAAAKCVD